MMNIVPTSQNALVSPLFGSFVGKVLIERVQIPPLCSGTQIAANIMITRFSLWEDCGENKMNAR